MITRQELEELEDAVVAALAGRDTDALNVIGFGDISVALGWPTVQPTIVCKRMPPFTEAQFHPYEQLIADYIERVRAAGVAVVDTTVMRLERDGRVITYLVQPMLASETLGHRVLSAAEPDPEHPFLVALADVLRTVSPTLSVDAQVTNFAWDGSAPTLLDVGTPFLWDGDGQLLFDMQPFARMIPAVLRPLVIRDLTKLVGRWQDPRQVAADIAANLHREGLTEWVKPALATFNQALDAEPLSVADAMALYEEDVKTFPRLKRLQAAERWWQTSIRRRPYDFFIESTYGDR